MAVAPISRKPITEGDTITSASSKLLDISEYSAIIPGHTSRVYHLQSRTRPVLFGIEIRKGVG